MLLNIEKRLKCILKRKVNKVMRIINIVNIEDEPWVIKAYTEEAFLDYCNYRLSASYTMDELPKAERAYLDKFKHLELDIVELVTEFVPSCGMMKKKLEETGEC